MTSPKEKSSLKKRNTIILIIITIFIVIAIAWFCFWFFYGRYHIKTDDAYVHGNKVMLTPQIESGVEVIFAEQTDLVEKGQLVVQLDNSNYLLNLEFLKEQLGNTVRRVSGYFFEAEVKCAELVLARANLRQAELDLQHREGLVQTGAISEEVYEQYQTNVIVTGAKVAVAEQQLELAQALITGVCIQTHPEVLEMVTAVKESYLNLIRCQVLAPVTGYIAKRTAQSGDYVKAGTTLLEIVPLNCLWVEANFKENMLKKIRMGQTVTYTADMHGRSVKYKGHVVGFQPGSGNAFALLPPEDASGNWIKVVQRVPVRVSVSAEQVRENPLFLGVSIKIDVHARDIEGEMISQKPTMQPIYATDIYQTQYKQMELINPEIERIIQENLRN